MKADRNKAWAFLAFSLAMQWMDACPAESNLPEPAKADETNTGSSPATSKWRLPKFIDGWKLPETVQIHGFASQSYIYTSGNNFFGHSTNTGSLDFTELGINGSWRPLPQLQTSMQVVYRRAGLTDDSNVRIDFGFLDYSFISDADKILGVRLGRVVNPYGLYNDTRDMPFTRPSILLPQSIYFDVNRNFALSGDGIQVYGEHHSSLGDFSLQVNGIYTRTNDPDLTTNLSSGLPGSLIGEPSWTARLMYEWGGGAVRLGITGSGLNASYKHEGWASAIKPLDFRLSPIVFSAQYNAENWSLTSEYAIRNSEVSGLVNPSKSTTGESYYFQGSYRLIRNLEGFVRYDVQYEDTDDRNGQQYAARTGIPAYTRFAKDFTTGLRWDINDWCMVRAEYHRINGTGWISYLENKGHTEQHWDLFGLSANFRF